MKHHLNAKQPSAKKIQLEEKKETEKEETRKQTIEDASIQKQQCLWKPLPENKMADFQALVNTKYNKNFKTYNELYQFSVTHLSQFWSAVWEFCAIVSSAPYHLVVDESAPIYTIPLWFQGALLNYAENLLRKDNGLAIISVGEQTTFDSVSYFQLKQRVGQCARALKHAGVVMGDRVCGYVPNCVDSAIFMLATASLGAIWSSTSPDFGVAGVLDRFVQIEPKVLVSCNAVTYNGKNHDHLEKLSQVAKNLPSLQKVVVFSLIEPIRDISFIQNAYLYLIQSLGLQGSPNALPILTEYSNLNQGLLIQHLKEHVIHGSMTHEDVFFYYTTTGWMMWNWLLSGLSTGATLVLYDGSPFKPSPKRLFELVDEFGITHFGVSAKYLQSLEEAGIKPNETFGLNSLKVIYSTGSPLKPTSFDYIYKSIKNVLVGSITGGTDIVSLFAGHNCALPVYRGEIQCRCLGMAIEAWDDSGKPVFDEPGDLVCTKPFPVMPVYFWNDPKGEKYKSAYFSTYQGVWYHGDYLSINSHTGGVVMLGRSDGTLNPAGVRFGSAEIYNIMIEFPEVADSLAVGQKQGEDERVVLFCKMAPGKSLDADLISRIKLRIRTLLSPRHVPALIIPIEDIPYTLTGKKVEVAVKKIISGQNVTPSSAIANPDSLKLYYKIRELSNSSL